MQKVVVKTRDIKMKARVNINVFMSSCYVRISALCFTIYTMTVALKDLGSSVFSFFLGFLPLLFSVIIIIYYPDISLFSKYFVRGTRIRVFILHSQVILFSEQFNFISKIN